MDDDAKNSIAAEKGNMFFLVFRMTSSARKNERYLWNERYDTEELQLMVRHAG